MFSTAGSRHCRLRLGKSEQRLDAPSASDRRGEIKSGNGAAVLIDLEGLDDRRAFAAFGLFDRDELPSIGITTALVVRHLRSP